MLSCIPANDTAPGPSGSTRSAIREIGAEVARFDRSAFAGVAGARAAIAVSLAAVIGLLTGHAAVAATMTAGSLLVSIPAAISRRPLSPSMLCAIALAMALSAFVGSATGSLGWVHTVVLVPWCLAAGLLVGTDNAASLGTQAVAALIVFGHFTASARSAVELSAYVLAGSAVAIAVVLVARLGPGNPRSRLALATACELLARLATTHGEADAIAVAEAIDEAEAVMDSEPGQTSLPDPSRALLDVLRRVRLELVAVDAARQRYAPSDATNLAAAATAFEHAEIQLSVIATWLRRPAETPARTDPSPEFTTPSGGVDPALAARLLALSGQLRAADALARDATIAARQATLASMTWPTSGTPRPGAAWRELANRIRAHASLRSPIGRHAVRLATAVTVAEILAKHIGLERSYWVALTVSVVLRPEFGSTFGRGAARVLGTSFGAVLASLIAVEIGGHDAAEVVAVALLCGGACALFSVSYVAFSCLLTALVVVILGIASTPTVAVALTRLVDTAIGGALALIFFALWPTRSRAQLQPTIAAYADALRTHLGDLLSILGGSREIDRQTLHLGARRVRLALTEARATLERAAVEPWAAPRALVAARRVLGGLGRLSLVAFALRSDLESARIRPIWREFEPLSNLARDELAWVAATLETRSADVDLDRSSQDPIQRRVDEGRLRAAFDAGVNASRSDYPGATPFADLDELVDAINTLGAVLEDLPQAALSYEGLLSRSLRQGSAARRRHRSA